MPGVTFNPELGGWVDIDTGTNVAAPNLAVQPAVQPAPGLSVKSGAAVDKGMTPNMSVFGDTGLQYGQTADGGYQFNGDPISAADYAVLRANSPEARAQTATANADFAASMADAHAASPFAVTPQPAPPINQPLPPGVADPTLMPANDKYATPYYAAYTDNGDFTGAVMAGEGQSIRLVDPKTGEVVYQGSGPEGARVATAIANSISQGDGKKAAWQIQADYGDKGWVAQAEDKVDTVHQSLLGRLADIALPILGTILLPGIGTALGLGATGAGALGAAIGSGVSSVAQGRALGPALLAAGLSGAGAAIAPSITGALRNFGGNGALSQFAAENALTPGAAAAGGGALSSAGDTLIGNAGADTLGANTVEELVVNAARSGLTDSQIVAQLIAQGLSSTAATAAVSASRPPVDEVVATAPAPSRPDFGSTLGALGTVGAEGAAGPDPTGASEGPDTFGGSDGTNFLQSGSRGDTLGPSSLLDKALTTIKANPIQDALLALSLAGALGGSGSKGSFAVPTGANGPGTRGSLDPVFSAGLPAPTFGARTQRAAPDINWQRYAIDNPEQSFFNHVAAPTAQFSVPSPQQNRMTGIGDLNHDGLVDALDLAIFRKKFGGRGFAKGGRAQFAVQGDGTGRSDSIPAKLSDGEYVMDAETVSLLGDGSSKAGAAKLDRFRVNLRKHKGRQLARGRFSVDAKDPEAYLAGGRAR